MATLDVDGFWRPFHQFLAQLVDLGFMARSPILDVSTVEDLLPALGG
jgi:hypothetical protein